MRAHILDLLDERANHYVELQQAVCRAQYRSMGYRTVKMTSQDNSRHYRDKRDGRNSNDEGLTCRSPAPNVDNGSNDCFNEQTD